MDRTLFCTSCVLATFLGGLFLLPGMLGAESSESSKSSEPSEPGVTIDTNRRTYFVGDVVDIVVENKTPSKVFIPGCQPYQVERFGDERFEAIEGEHCIAEGDARAVGPGKRTLQFHPKAEHVDRPLRVSLVYGLGCAEKRPLSQARCTDFVTIYTRSFRVRETAPGK